MPDPVARLKKNRRAAAAEPLPGHRMGICSCRLIGHHDLNHFFAVGLLTSVSQTRASRARRWVSTERSQIMSFQSSWSW